MKIDAASAAVGMYDGILLEVAIDDGSTLYSNITVYVTEPGAADLPDLTVNSGDISFTSENSALTATVHNRGNSPASNVQVEFYEFGTLLGTTVIDEIPAGGIRTAAITASMAGSGDRLVRVVVDPAGNVQELDENNNEASQVIQLGGTPSPTEGNILVTGSLPSTVYTDALFSLTGRAVYNITTADGTRYTNYVVKGGSVAITIQGEGSAVWTYGNIHTDVNGNFTKFLLAPPSPGTYRITMTVTDKTFIGTRELVFSVVERPATPPPPSPPCVDCSGTWSYDPVLGQWTWTWTWTVPGPVPQSDIRVFSENIYFSENHPAAHQEITVFAEILYWASSTALVAKNIPVSVYVTYPDEPKEKIGQTVIPRLSVGAPDNGSRYVFATWKNPGDGIYLVEVEIDPSYAEENKLNNAATRAIIVGQVASNQGAIAGQVTDALGGVDNVTISVFDTNSQLLGSTVTNATGFYPGFYLVKNVPVGEWEVRIDTPAGYADAETKTANVANQSVSEVNFYLTEQTEEEDTTPPVITPTVNGTLGSNGWYTSDVTVSWSVVDDESPITAQEGCEATTVTTDTPLGLPSPARPPAAAALPQSQ